MNRYQIMLYGINRNYNLNKIIALRINLYAIKIEKKAIYIIISKEDYPKLKNIKHKIVNYYGPLKIKRMIQNNYILVIGIIIAVLIPLLLSKLIFKIDINHPNQNLRKIIRNDLGIKARYYDLRGSFATTSLRSGCEIKDIAEVLGHRRIETTEKYYISSTKTDKINVTKSFEKSFNFYNNII